MTDEIVKVCKVHGKLLKDQCYFINNKKERARVVCKKCAYINHRKFVNKNKAEIKEKNRDYCKKYRFVNPEKVKISKKKYYENNKEKAAEYRKSNPELVKKWSQRTEQKAICSLSDSYMKKLIVKSSKGLKGKDLPDFLINLKRQQIQSLRGIYEKN